MSSESALGRAARYGVWLILFLSVPNLIHAMPPTRSWLPEYRPSLKLIETKNQIFIKNKNRFNLIFLGDSKAYHTYDPETIDRALGTRSYSLTEMSHRFPTQYSQARDLLAQIPRTTTVVWSIGPNNFTNAEVNEVYPIWIKYLPDYFRMGYAWSRVKKNVVTYNFFRPYAAWVPGLYGYVIRGDLKVLVDQWKQSPIRKSAAVAAASPVKNRSAYLAVKRQFAGRSDVTVGARIEGGAVVAAVLQKAQGNVAWVEIDRQFFRRWQAKDALERQALLNEPDLKVDAANWNCYIETLELFKKSGARLVVSELGEAPYSNGSPAHRKAVMDLLERTRSEAERRGIPYIRFNHDDYLDQDYMDLNHLNFNGLIKFHRYFIPALSKLIRGV
jgi:hypothetical protein